MFQHVVWSTSAQRQRQATPTPPAHEIGVLPFINNILPYPNLKDDTAAG